MDALWCVSPTSRRVAMSLACSSWMYSLCFVTWHDNLASELLRLPMRASRLLSAAVMSVICNVTTDSRWMTSPAIAHQVLSADDVFRQEEH